MTRYGRKRKEIENFAVEKDKKKTHKIARTIGATSVVIGSAVVATKAVPKLTAAINKASVKYSNRKSGKDNWEPEIVKKNEYKESERDGDANRY